jgi:hypothetical protein
LIVFAPQASRAQAQQLARSFVSAATGNDANDCNRLTPCRTFQRAHDNTFDQGEVTVLDTGGYGAVTIRKSISIVSEVGEASILVSGGATGIEISAGPAAYVNLRGITIQGIGFGGSTGLRFDNGFALTITNCVVRNHTGSGIELRPSGNSHLAVSSTLVADNGQSGVFVQPTGSGAVKLAMKRVEAYNNSVNGFIVDGSLMSGNGIDATISDSVSAGSNGTGFKAVSRTNLAVTRSIAANNGTGVASVSTASTFPFLVISESTITGNTTTWFSSSSLASAGDNLVFFNQDLNPSFPGTFSKK